jgi:hypothetical protein
MRARATFGVVLAAIMLALPAAAHAKTTTYSAPPSLVDTGDLIPVSPGSTSLTLPYQATTVFDGRSVEFEPRSVRVDSDGSILVACGKHGYIMRIYRDGRAPRTYTAREIPGLERPFDALPLSDGGMLIVDRGSAAGTGRVFRVDSSLRTVWQFGGTSGMGAGEVWDPFTAELIDNGTRTLIADSLGYRVIEVDNASGDVKWSYGTYKKQGPGDGLLIRPHSAQRLANGNTLICDSEAFKVLEVNPAGTVVWHYGTGVKGSGPGQLSGPNSARRLANGNTLISDSENSRVIEVNGAGETKQAYNVAGRTPAGGVLSDPRAAVRLANGETLIADLGNMRLVSYGYRARYEYVVTSRPVGDSALKAFSSVRLVPPSSRATLQYSIDNGAFMEVPRDGRLSDASGFKIRYRIRMTASADSAPVIGKVAITWGPYVPTKSTNTTKTTTKNGSHASTTTAPPSPQTSTTTTRTANGSFSRVGGGVGTGTRGTKEFGPGGNSQLRSGSTGTAGGKGAGATQSQVMSGWVMSEVKSDASGPKGLAAGGRVGNRALQGRNVPSVPVLLGVYLAGLTWAPLSGLAVRLIALAMAH